MKKGAFGQAFSIVFVAEFEEIVFVSEFEERIGTMKLIIIDLFPSGLYFNNSV